jgi:dCMP deaminase
MEVAEVVAKKSDCFRAKHGAVIVSPDNRIIATGYNGPPASYFKSERDFFDCRAYCSRAALNEYDPCYDNCPSIHAESNAVAWADRSAMRGGTIYVNGWPCLTCTKLMANCGLDRIVVKSNYETPYRDEDPIFDFMANVKMTKLMVIRAGS